MVTYTTIILQFADQGEKTGWTYIDIPADIAQQLKPGNKKSFRVRGMLDSFKINGVALMPMGEGGFIMAINADMRKGIRKHKGAILQVNLEEDVDYQVLMPDDLHECFDYEPEALEFFNTLAKSHRNYFIKWIDSAKTEPTRANRIVNTINAMLHKWSYSEMMRAMKKERE
ncbi:MAG: YdeI/OmpD-associated family protein [Bacteroidota bacterium]